MTFDIAAKGVWFATEAVESCSYCSSLDFAALSVWTIYILKSRRSGDAILLRLFTSRI